MKYFFSLTSSFTFPERRKIGSDFLGVMANGALSGTTKNPVIECVILIVFIVLILCVHIYPQIDLFESRLQTVTIPYKTVNSVFLPSKDLKIRFYDLPRCQNHCWIRRECQDLLVPSRSAPCPMPILYSRSHPKFFRIPYASFLQCIGSFLICCLFRSCSGVGWKMPRKAS
jgi:hypothetical protein